MKRGTDGCSFQIDLFRLAPREASSLACSSQRAAGGSDTKSVLNDGQEIVVKLGYLTALLKKVLDGIIDSAVATVQTDKLVTTIKGSRRLPRFKANIVRIHFYTTNGGFRCDSATAERRDHQGGEVSLLRKSTYRRRKPETSRPS